MCRGLKAPARKVVPVVWKGSARFRLTPWRGWGGGGAAESFTGGNGGRETLGSGKEIEGCLGELAQGAGRARRTGLEPPDTRGAVAQRHDEWAGPAAQCHFLFFNGFKFELVKRWSCVLKSFKIKYGHVDDEIRNKFYYRSFSKFKTES
jgi:hypothetical protein